MALVHDTPDRKTILSCVSSGVTASRLKAKPNRATPNQTKPNQTKPFLAAKRIFRTRL